VGKLGVLDDDPRPDEAAVLRLMQGFEYPAVVRRVDQREAILRLLARGETHREIARRLDLHERQVDRLIAALRAA
jgi:DNA-binding NarL/FixJ family response regulator